MSWDAVVQPIIGSYDIVKDSISLLSKKTKYAKELDTNLIKLSEEMVTFYSQLKKVNQVCERAVFKRKNDRYRIYLKRFKTGREKYKEFFDKYREHCLPAESSGNSHPQLASLPADLEDSTNVPTLESVIDALNTRNPTIVTRKRKFFELAALSENISKLCGEISVLSKEMEAENVLIDKEIVPVQEKRDVVEIPSFTEYVKKILDYLTVDENRSIGIWGPIAVGKTQVMELLNNHLRDDPSTLSSGIESLKFELVILIKYKQSDAEEKIIKMMQDEIIRRLKLKTEKENNTEENAEIISTALMHKKYVLLIDQVSSNFVLDQVGIREDHKLGKVVIASSNRKVITGMTDVDVEVRALLEETSFDLFQKFSGTINDPRIRGIAMGITKSLGGLPHVIKAVAKNLKGKTDEKIWSNANEKLQSEAELLKLGGIGNAYKMLYDKLENSHKKCLLFVALFPRDHEIYKDYLAECWKAERFLDREIQEHRRAERYLELRRARDRGAGVLEDLTDQLLLVNSSDMQVKMPVYVRTMALAQNYPGEVNCNFWAPHMDRVCDAETWRTSKRMSLIGLKSKLPERPESKNMCTLLLQKNPREATLGDSFFLDMQKLLILDLHQTGIKSLPSSTSSLINLTCLYLNDCSLLVELSSGVKELKMLEVFDIRGTSIRHLPNEVGEMSELRCLRITFSPNECNRKSKGKVVEMTIPPNIISRLQQLEELIIEVGCCSQGWNEIVDQLTEELTCLEKLNALSFHFPTASGLKKFVTDSKSLKNTETDWGTNTFSSFKISVGCCERQHPYGEDLSGVFGERLLRFSSNEEISSVEEVLRQTSSFELVAHSDVGSLSDFSLENTGALKVCVLEKCKRLSSVVDIRAGNSGMTDSGILQCLEKLHLFDLQLLSCLWKGSVFSNCLSRLKVLTMFGCPELTEILSPELARALSSLEHLRVENCSKIKEIVKTQNPDVQNISEHVELSDILHRVQVIELVDLQELQSICSSTSVNWKSLRKIEIKRCTNLRNIGSTLREGGMLQRITCAATWWDELDLPNEEKSKLLPCCDFVLEQPLVVGTFHEGESSNQGRPADLQPSDTIVPEENHDEIMLSNGNDLPVFTIDSVVHADFQYGFEHVNHQSTSKVILQDDEVGRCLGRDSATIGEFD